MIRTWDWLETITIPVFNPAIIAAEMALHVCHNIKC